MNRCVLTVLMIFSLQTSLAWGAVDVVDKNLAAIAKQQLAALQAIQKDTNTILTVLQSIQQAIGDPTTQPNEVLSAYIEKVNTTFAASIGVDPKDLKLNAGAQNAAPQQRGQIENVQFKPTNAQVAQNAAADQHVKGGTIFKQIPFPENVGQAQKILEEGAIPAKTFLNQLEKQLLSTTQDSEKFNTEIKKIICNEQNNNNCIININTIVNKYAKDGKITSSDATKIYSEILFLANDKELTQNNVGQLNQLRGALSVNTIVNNLGANAYRLGVVQEIPKTLLVGGHAKCAAAKNGGKLNGDDCANLASLMLSSRNLLSKADAELALNYTTFMLLLTQAYSVAEQTVQQGISLSASGLNAQPFKTEE